jgi:hypothetical protein
MIASNTKDRGSSYMTPTDLWTLLIVGVIIGWYIGRWRAENRRARFDMNNTWNSRQNYRKG